ncbi:MAG: Nif3-like dinuclear metal center hexameric protein [Verrucomicrobia bacterium]|nr:Nif3-like dinuclear metal center hexameric protein [Verrucomicrobiota bacterium]
MKLSEVTDFLNGYLGISEIQDYPNALNGLQLENDGRVGKLGAAVDASEPVLRAAIEAQVDLLMVHHGLFWGGLTRMVGSVYRKFHLAMAGNLAVYSAHLPLDLHPVVGNNVLLAQRRGCADLKPFFIERGVAIGVAAEICLARDELVRRLEQTLQRKVWMAAAGPAEIHRVGIVTGGAGAEVGKAAAEGVDTFVTGEGPHHTFGLAEELGVNLIYGGHYATETFGVCALGEMLSQRLGVPWVFLDHPSGL